MNITSPYIHDEGGVFVSVRVGCISLGLFTIDSESTNKVSKIAPLKKSYQLTIENFSAGVQMKTVTHVQVSLQSFVVLDARPISDGK